MISDTAVIQTGRTAFAARIGRAVPAGILGGAVFGLGLRIAMRVAALVEGLETGFTVPGTIGIVVMGMIFGAVFGPVAVMIGRLWRGRMVLGATAAGALLGLFFVLAVAGSEITDVGDTAVNLVTFGASGAAFGATTAWAAGRRREIDVPAHSVRGAIVAGTVAATALVSAVGSPITAWILDRFDGGTPVHPQLPTLRDPRVEGLGDLLGGALGGLIGGAFLGLALAGLLLLVRRWVVATDRPVATIGVLLAVLGGLTLLIPNGPRTTGNTAIVAAGIAVMAIAIAWSAVRFSRWFQPDVWGARAD